MPTQAEWTERMRRALAISEPELDTSIGTVTRKILDSVAESLSEASIDRYLLSYTYDIETKSGADLDDFVRLFGFTRFPAKRATGELRFERTDTASEIIIPIGTQVGTDSNPAVIVATVVPAVMGIGDSVITVPAQAIQAGTVGNIAAFSVRVRFAPLQGVTAFTNPVAFTGGADTETDDQLRDRFKRTIFRNLAGTEQMFLGVALEDAAVLQANVIGASKRHREQIELVFGTADSTIVDAKSILGDPVFGVNIDAGDILAEDVHYDFDETNVNPGPLLQPRITSLDGLAAPDGIYDLDFSYVPNASRNEPDDGITNRVDVWTQGDRIIEATETLIWSNSRLFTALTTSDFYTQKFQREDESNPVVDNIFIPFTFSPVATVPEQLMIDGTPYFLDADYFLVQDITAFGMAPRSYSGIEWVSVANGGSEPPDGTPFLATYSFNSVPRDVERALQAWRLVTSDAWVHQAKLLRLNLYFVVIFSPGFDETLVKPELVSKVNEYLLGVGFTSYAQVSDLLAVASSVGGIDAVRFLTGNASDGTPTNYAIERVDPNSNFLERFEDVTTLRAIDVPTEDDAVAVLNDIIFDVRAQNTFRAGT